MARAVEASLLADDPYDGALNVASGTPRSVLDLAWATCEGTDLVPEVSGVVRPGDVRHVVASPARATERLGFVAEEPFDLDPFRPVAGAL